MPEKTPPLTSLPAILNALNLSSEAIIVFEPVSGPDGAVSDMRLELMNDAAVRMFGLTREQGIGRLLSGLWRMEDEGNNWRIGLEVIATGKSYRFEWQTAGLGDTRWFEVTLQAYGGHLAASYRDISASKAALSEVERQKEFYEMLLEQSISRKAILAPVYDAAGDIENFRYEYANYGKDIDDAHRRIPFFESVVPGMLVTELLPMIRQTPVWDFYVEVATSGQPMRTELWYREGGTDHAIDLSGKRLKDGRILIAYSDISDTHRVAKALEVEKIWFNALFESVPIGLTVFEPVRNDTGDLIDLRLIRRNRIALSLSRIPADKYLTGALLSELMPVELSAGMEIMLNVVRTGQTAVYELYQPHLDKWISSRIMKHGDGLLSTIQDVTETRKHAEELQRQAALLEGILQASPHAIIVFEAVRGGGGDILDFRIIRLNDKAPAISGASADALSGALLFDCVPALREKLPLYEKVVSSREPESYESYNDQVGRWRCITNTPLDDGFVMTLEDITVQKEQRKIMEEQATLFNGVLRSLQNGLTIFRIIRDDAGRLEDLEYVQIADSVARDTGMAREEKIGTRMRSQYPGIEDTEYWQAFTRVAETGEPVNFETHFTLSGYDNHLLNWVTPIGRDMLVSVYYIVNDLKRAQQELEHTIQELKRSNEDLEQFASIASHDLQEPLRKVQSFGTMLETRYAEVLGADGKDLINRMQSAAARMRNLVTGLLSFSRLAGDEHTPLIPVDMQGLLQEVMGDLDQSAEDAGSYVHVMNRLPFVQGIDSQLRHLFHNLLTNALKFRTPDVTADIRVSAGPLLEGDAAHLSPLSRPEQYLRFEVTDNGIGFEPEYAEKIFGLFERLHGLSKYPGTGIGLSICRRVAERHKGAIWAESTPGAGATFIILLQKAEPLSTSS